MPDYLVEIRDEDMRWTEYDRTPFENLYNSVHTELYDELKHLFAFMDDRELAATAEATVTMFVDDYEENSDFLPEEYAKTQVAWEHMCDYLRYVVWHPEVATQQIEEIPS